jgi:hypothetical protein
VFIGGLGCHVEWRGGFEVGAVLVLVGTGCESALLLLTLELRFACGVYSKLWNVYEFINYCMKLMLSRTNEIWGLK